MESCITQNELACLAQSVVYSVSLDSCKHLACAEVTVPALFYNVHEPKKILWEHLHTVQVNNYCNINLYCLYFIVTYFHLCTPSSIAQCRQWWAVAAACGTTEEC